MFNNLTAYLDRCLEEMDRKAASGGLDENDLHYGDLIAHFAKSLDTHVAMQEQGGYSGRNYRDGDMSRDSSRRNDGSSYGGTWPMMGTMPTRPMSRGYSRADRMDELVQVMGGAMNGSRCEHSPLHSRSTARPSAAFLQHSHFTATRPREIPGPCL